ncbi:MAG: AAA family ATPase [Rhizobiales bacterium]|nr:AAA family ATPase [Hyphomicrobiales bacterium]
MTTAINGNGQKEWAPPRSVPERATDEEREQWREVTARVRAIAEREEWSKSEVARLAGVPMGTFSPWYDGTYGGLVGRQTRLVARWLDSLDEGARFSAALPEPGFVKTPTAAEIFDRLVIAQELPTIAVIVVGPGIGKTFTAEHYAKTHPHVTMVTMRPTTGELRPMLKALAGALDVRGRDYVTTDAAIGAKLMRNGRKTLLIVDEAQHCSDEAVNQLRYFKDQFGCGIALLGNDDLYGRFPATSARAMDAQIRRRIFIWLRRLTPLAGDIDAYVKAWRLEDKDVANLARAIGRRPGALGGIAETLKLAHIMAAADEKPLSADYVHQAWENRGDDALAAPRRPLASAA